MPSAVAPNKRLRTEIPEKAQKAAPKTRILAPYRSIGHVTKGNVPFTSIPLGDATYQITTAVGTTFQTYDFRKLTLVFVSSPQTPSPIQRLLAWKDVVFAAFDGGIWIYKRGKKIAELEEPLGGWEGKGELKEFIIFGDWAIAGYAKGEMLVWKTQTKEFYTSIKSPIAGNAREAEVMALVHPTTYLNKVVVARANGSMEIWNVKTGKLIYTILLPPPSSASGLSVIASVVQTPALNILAIAYSNGEILFHNILADLTIFRLKHQSASATQNRITSLSFCLDPTVGAGEGGGSKDVANGAGRVLVASDSSGDVTIWDLKVRRVIGVLRNAHFGAITKAEFMTGQNLLITTGVDNSIKEWVFDSPHSPLPRLLKMRGGHSQPPTTLTFWKPEESHFLLSSSLDQSLWGISLRNDAQNFELSQGAGTNAMANSRESVLAKKAGPITALACAPETGMQRDWESIVTAHRGERAARTWTFKNKRVGRWTFETADKSEVKAVAISACGNFALIGSALGGIEMFNLQSGKKRKEYPEPRRVGKKVFKMPGGHTKAVTALLTDEVNKVVISTGLDGKIKFWNFHTGAFTSEIDWSSSCGITAARLYTSSDLLACACDDLGIRIVDTTTQRVVRELWGCNGRITDLTFSHDGRWLIASSLDSTLRIWDLPTGHLVERITTPSIITALAFSGTGEFLATAHVGDVGVNLWTNKTLFSRTPTRAIPDDETILLSNPTTSGEGGTGLIDVATTTAPTEDHDADDMSLYNPLNQLSTSLQTLSLLPPTRYQTLIHLDLIRARNKPTEAPKAPEKAPFFLPSLSGHAHPNASNNPLPLTNPDPTGPSGTHSALLAQSASLSQSRFTALLHTNSRQFIDHLLTLPPSATSLEIRSLDPTKDEATLFVNAVTARMQDRKDWEMCQAWMRMFLKAWGEDVVGENDAEEEEWKGFEDEEEDEESRDWRVPAREALKEWRRVQEEEGERVAALGGWTMGVGAFLRGF